MTIEILVICLAGAAAVLIGWVLRTKPDPYVGLPHEGDEGHIFWMGWRYDGVRRGEPSIPDRIAALERRIAELECGR